MKPFKKTKSMFNEKTSVWDIMVLFAPLFSRHNFSAALFAQSTKTSHPSMSCFTLILCGEPYLNNPLRWPVHEALRQHITVCCNFSGLSNARTAAYIRHKIACAGSFKTIMGPELNSPPLAEKISSDHIDRFFLVPVLAR